MVVAKALLSSISLPVSVDGVHLQRASVEVPVLAIPGRAPLRVQVTGTNMAVSHLSHSHAAQHFASRVKAHIANAASAAQSAGALLERATRAAIAGGLSSTAAHALALERGKAQRPLPKWRAWVEHLGLVLAHCVDVSIESTAVQLRVHETERLTDGHPSDMTMRVGEISCSTWESPGHASSCASNREIVAQVRVSSVTLDADSQPRRAQATGPDASIVRVSFARVHARHKLRDSAATAQAARLGVLRTARVHRVGVDEVAPRLDRAPGEEDGNEHRVSDDFEWGTTHARVEVGCLTLALPSASLSVLATHVASFSASAHPAVCMPLLARRRVAAWSRPTERWHSAFKTVIALLHRQGRFYFRREAQRVRIARHVFGKAAAELSARRAARGSTNALWTVPGRVDFSREAPPQPQDPTLPQAAQSLLWTSIERHSSSVDVWGWETRAQGLKLLLSDLPEHACSELLGVVMGESGSETTNFSPHKQLSAILKRLSTRQLAPTDSRALPRLQAIMDICSTCMSVSDVEFATVIGIALTQFEHSIPLALASSQQRALTDALLPIFTPICPSGEEVFPGAAIRARTSAQRRPLSHGAWTNPMWVRERRKWPGYSPHSLMDQLTGSPDSACMGLAPIRALFSNPAGPEWSSFALRRMAGRTIPSPQEVEQYWVDDAAVIAAYTTQLVSARPDTSASLLSSITLESILVEAGTVRVHLGTLSTSCSLEGAEGRLRAMGTLQSLAVSTSCGTQILAASPRSGYEHALAIHARPGFVGLEVAHEQSQLANQHDWGGVSLRDSVEVDTLETGNESESDADLEPPAAVTSSLFADEPGTVPLQIVAPTLVDGSIDISCGKISVLLNSAGAMELGAGIDELMCTLHSGTDDFTLDNGADVPVELPPSFWTRFSKEQSVRHLPGSVIALACEGLELGVDIESTFAFPRARLPDAATLEFAAQFDPDDRSSGTEESDRIRPSDVLDPREQLQEPRKLWSRCNIRTSSLKVVSRPPEENTIMGGTEFILHDVLIDFTTSDSTEKSWGLRPATLLSGATIQICVLMPCFAGPRNRPIPFHPGLSLDVTISKPHIALTPLLLDVILFVVGPGLSRLFAALLPSNDPGTTEPASAALFKDALCGRLRRQGRLTVSLIPPWVMQPYFAQFSSLSVSANVDVMSLSLDLPLRNRAPISALDVCVSDLRASVLMRTFDMEVGVSASSIRAWSSSFSERHANRAQSDAPPPLFLGIESACGCDGKSCECNPQALEITYASGPTVLFEKQEGGMATAAFVRAPKPITRTIGQASVREHHFTRGSAIQAAAEVLEGYEPERAFDTTSVVTVAVSTLFCNADAETLGGVMEWISQMGSAEPCEPTAPSLVSTGDAVDWARATVFADRRPIDCSLTQVAVLQTTVVAGTGSEPLCLATLNGVSLELLATTARLSPWESASENPPSPESLWLKESQQSTSIQVDSIRLDHCLDAFGAHPTILERATLPARIASPASSRGNSSRPGVAETPSGSLLPWSPVRASQDAPLANESPRSSTKPRLARAGPMVGIKIAMIPSDIKGGQCAFLEHSIDVVLVDLRVTYCAAVIDDLLSVLLSGRAGAALGLVRAMHPEHRFPRSDWIARCGLIPHELPLRTGAGEMPISASEGESEGSKISVAVRDVLLVVPAARDSPDCMVAGLEEVFVTNFSNSTANTSFHPPSPALQAWPFLRPDSDSPDRSHEPLQSWVVGLQGFRLYDCQLPDPAAVVAHCLWKKIASTTAELLRSSEHECIAESVPFSLPDRLWQVSSSDPGWSFASLQKCMDNTLSASSNRILEFLAKICHQEGISAAKHDVWKLWTNMNDWDVGLFEEEYGMLSCITLTGGSSEADGPLLPWPGHVCSDLENVLCLLQGSRAVAVRRLRRLRAITRHPSALSISVHLGSACTSVSVLSPASGLHLQVLPAHVSLVNAMLSGNLADSGTLAREEVEFVATQALRAQELSTTQQPSLAPETCTLEANIVVLGLSVVLARPQFQQPHGLDSLPIADSHLEAAKLGDRNWKSDSGDSNLTTAVSCQGVMGFGMDSLNVSFSSGSDWMCAGAGCGRLEVTDEREGYVSFSPEPSAKSSVSLLSNGMPVTSPREPVQQHRDRISTQEALHLRPNTSSALHSNSESQRFGDAVLLSCDPMLHAALPAIANEWAACICAVNPCLQGAELRRGLRQTLLQRASHAGTLHTDDDETASRSGANDQDHAWQRMATLLEDARHNPIPLHVLFASDSKGTRAGLALDSVCCSVQEYSFVEDVLGCLSSIQQHQGPVGTGPDDNSVPVQSEPASPETFAEVSIDLSRPMIVLPRFLGKERSSALVIRTPPHGRIAASYRCSETATQVQASVVALVAEHAETWKGALAYSRRILTLEENNAKSISAGVLSSSSLPRVPEQSSRIRFFDAPSDEAVHRQAARASTISDVLKMSSDSRRLRRHLAVRRPHALTRPRCVLSPVSVAARYTMACNVPRSDEIAAWTALSSDRLESDTMLIVHLPAGPEQLLLPAKLNDVGGPTGLSICASQKDVQIISAVLERWIPSEPSHPSACADPAHRSRVDSDSSSEGEEKVEAADTTGEASTLLLSAGKTVAPAHSSTVQVYISQASLTFVDSTGTNRPVSRLQLKGAVYESTTFPDDGVAPKKAWRRYANEVHERWTEAGRRSALLAQLASQKFDVDVGLAKGREVLSRDRSLQVLSTVAEDTSPDGSASETDEEDDLVAGLGSPGVDAVHAQLHAADIVAVGANVHGASDGQYAHLAPHLTVLFARSDMWASFYDSLHVCWSPLLEPASVTVASLSSPICGDGTFVDIPGPVNVNVSESTLESYFGLLNSLSASTNTDHKSIRSSTAAFSMRNSTGEQLRFCIPSLLETQGIRVSGANEPGEDETEALRVTILSATGLLDADGNTFSDPYVRCTFRQHSCETSVISNSLAPHWYEHFDFDVPRKEMVAMLESSREHSTAMEALQIDVLDFDEHSEHDRLGAAVIPLSVLQLSPGEGIDLVVPLSLSGRLAGRVFMRVAWAIRALPIQDSPKLDRKASRRQEQSAGHARRPRLPSWRRRPAVSPALRAALASSARATLADEMGTMDHASQVLDLLAAAQAYVSPGGVEALHFPNRVHDETCSGIGLAPLLRQSSSAPQSAQQVAVQVLGYDWVPAVDASRPGLQLVIMQPRSVTVEHAASVSKYGMSATSNNHGRRSSEILARQGTKVGPEPLPLACDVRRTEVGGLELVLRSTVRVRNLTSSSFEVAAVLKSGASLASKTLASIAKTSVQMPPGEEYCVPLVVLEAAVTAHQLSQTKGAERAHVKQLLRNVRSRASRYSRKVHQVGIMKRARRMRHRKGRAHSSNSSPSDSSASNSQLSSSSSSSASSSSSDDDDGIDTRQVEEKTDGGKAGDQTGCLAIRPLVTDSFASVALASILPFEGHRAASHLRWLPLSDGSRELIVEFPLSETTSEKGARSYVLHVQETKLQPTNHEPQKTTSATRRHLASIDCEIQVLVPLLVESALPVATFVRVLDPNAKTISASFWLDPGCAVEVDTVNLHAPVLLFATFARMHTDQPALVHAPPGSDMRVDDMLRVVDSLGQSTWIFIEHCDASGARLPQGDMSSRCARRVVLYSPFWIVNQSPYDLWVRQAGSSHLPAGSLPPESALKHVQGSDSTEVSMDLTTSGVGGLRLAGADDAASRKIGSPAVTSLEIFDPYDPFAIWSRRSQRDLPTEEVLRLFQERTHRGRRILAADSWDPAGDDAFLFAFEIPNARQTAGAMLLTVEGKGSRASQPKQGNSRAEIAVLTGMNSRDATLFAFRPQLGASESFPAMSKWSTPFGLSTVGVTQSTSCAGPFKLPVSYSFGTMSRIGTGVFRRTMIVVVSPRYVIENRLDTALILAQKGTAIPVRIPPNASSPFQFPSNGDEKIIRCRYDSTWNWTGYFAVDEGTSAVLQMEPRDTPRIASGSRSAHLLDAYAKSSADLTSLHLVFKRLPPGFSPYRLQNSLSSRSIAVKQFESSEARWLILGRGESMEYTWTTPSENPSLIVALDATSAVEADSLPKAVVSINDMASQEVPGQDGTGAVFLRIHVEGRTRVVTFAPEIPVQELIDATREEVDQLRAALDASAARSKLFGKLLQGTDDDLLHAFEEEQRSGASLGRDTDASGELRRDHVRVVIHSASDLLSADSNGFSDPFVELTVEPPVQSSEEQGARRARRKSPGGSGRPKPFKTGVEKRTLDPVWKNATFMVPVGPASTATSRDLHFHVFDHDILSSNDSLGCAKVPISSLESQQPVPLSLPLLPSSPGAEAQGFLEVTCHWIYNVRRVYENLFSEAEDAVRNLKEELHIAKERLSVAVQQEEKQLKRQSIMQSLRNGDEKEADVRECRPRTAIVARMCNDVAEDARQAREKQVASIKRVLGMLMRARARAVLDGGDLSAKLTKAVGLPSADSNGLSDPYAFITCGGFPHKTTTVRRSLSPAWPDDPGCVAQLSHPDVGLRICLIDEDLVGADDPMGELSLSVSDINMLCSRGPVRQWFALGAPTDVDTDYDASAAVEMWTGDDVALPDVALTRRQSAAPQPQSDVPSRTAHGSSRPRGSLQRRETQIIGSGEVRSESVANALDDTTGLQRSELAEGGVRISRVPASQSSLSSALPSDANPFAALSGFRSTTSLFSSPSAKLETLAPYGAVCLELQWQPQFVKGRHLQSFVSVSVGGVGFSLVDGQAGRELLHLSLRDAIVVSTETDKESSGRFTLETMQLDNALVDASLKTILSMTPKHNPPPFLHVHFALNKARSTDDIAYYRRLLGMMQEIDLVIEAEWLEVIGNFAHRILEMVELQSLSITDENGLGPGGCRRATLNTAQDFQELTSPTHVDGGEQDAAPSVKPASDRVFVETMQVHPLKANVTFQATGAVYAPGPQPAKRNETVAWILGIVLSYGGVLHNAPLRFNVLLRENVFCTRERLGAVVQAHYIQQATAQLYLVLGNLDIVSAPVNLVKSLGSGVADLFYEPYQGMAHDASLAAGLGTGLAKGTISLVHSSLSGTAGAAGKLTAAAGNALAKISFDSDYLASRSRLRMERKAGPKGVSTGMKNAGMDLGRGILGGVTGIVQAPVVGARRGGVAGFFKGVGVGVVGVVVKPTAGIFDFCSQASASLQSAAVSLVGGDRTVLPTIRRRLPRVFHPTGRMVAYSYRGARAQHFFTLKSGTGTKRPLGGLLSKTASVDRSDAVVDIVRILPPTASSYAEQLVQEEALARSRRKTSPKPGQNKALDGLRTSTTAHWLLLTRSRVVYITTRTAEKRMDVVWEIPTAAIDNCQNIAHDTVSGVALLAESGPPETKAAAVAMSKKMSNTSAQRSMVDCVKLVVVVDSRVPALSFPASCTSSVSVRQGGGQSIRVRASGDCEERLQQFRGLLLQCVRVRKSGPEQSNQMGRDTHVSDFALRSLHVIWDASADPLRELRLRKTVTKERERILAVASEMSGLSPTLSPRPSNRRRSTQDQPSSGRAGSLAQRSGTMGWKIDPRRPVFGVDLVSLWRAPSSPSTDSYWMERTSSGFPVMVNSTPKSGEPAAFTVHRETPRASSGVPGEFGFARLPLACLLVCKWRSDGGTSGRWELLSGTSPSSSEALVSETVEPLCRLAGKESPQPDEGSVWLCGLRCKRAPVLQATERMDVASLIEDKHVNSAIQDDIGVASSASSHRAAPGTPGNAGAARNEGDAVEGKIEETNRARRVQALAGVRRVLAVWTQSLSSSWRGLLRRHPHAIVDLVLVAPSLGELMPRGYVSVLLTAACTAEAPGIGTHGLVLGYQTALMHAITATGNVVRGAAPRSPTPIERLKVVARMAGFGVPGVDIRSAFEMLRFDPLQYPALPTSSSGLRSSVLATVARMSPLGVLRDAGQARGDEKLRIALPVCASVDRLFILSAVHVAESSCLPMRAVGLWGSMLALGLFGGWCDAFPSSKAALQLLLEQSDAQRTDCHTPVGASPSPKVTDGEGDDYPPHPPALSLPERLLDASDQAVGATHIVSATREQHSSGEKTPVSREREDLAFRLEAETQARKTAEAQVAVLAEALRQERSERVLFAKRMRAEYGRALMLASRAAVSHIAEARRAEDMMLGARNEPYRGWDEDASVATSDVSGTVLWTRGHEHTGPGRRHEHPQQHSLLTPEHTFRFPRPPGA